MSRSLAFYTLLINPVISAGELVLPAEQCDAASQPVEQQHHTLTEPGMYIL